MNPRIVLPEWTLSLEANERELIMRHEVEHIRVGDPRLLLVAAVCLVLVPWNAALWFIVRRLRLAIEIDCDARVVRSLGQRREYGMLLLAAGARQTVSLSLAASLAERRPHLERRIVAMTSLRPARPVLASVPFVALVGVAAVVAAQTPRLDLRRVVAPIAIVATSPGAAAAVAVRIIPAPAMLPSVKAVSNIGKPVISPVSIGEPAPAVQSQLRTPAEDSAFFARVRSWIERYQPALARGDTTINEVAFAVDADSNIVGSAASYDVDFEAELARDRATAGSLRAPPPSGAPKSAAVLDNAMAQANPSRRAFNRVLVLTTDPGVVAPASVRTIVIFLTR